MWEIYERCSNLMVDYKERFGKNVPMELMFYSMETISDIVQKALDENKEIKIDNK